MSTFSKNKILTTHEKNEQIILYFRHKIKGLLLKYLKMLFQAYNFIINKIIRSLNIYTGKIKPIDVQIG